MFEKVNPKHPDKLTDRIAGAIVDFAYVMQKDPRIAVEVMLGHHACFIIAETSVHILLPYIRETVERIAGEGLAVIILKFRRIRNLRKTRKTASAAVTTGSSGECL